MRHVGITRATLLIAIATVARRYGGVAAMATLVAFTSSAVVLLGGWSAARPAAGALPTAGAFWWWPVAVGGLITARLFIAAFIESRWASPWRNLAFLVSLAATIGWRFWTARGGAPETRLAGALAIAGTLVLFVDALSDDEGFARGHVAVDQLTDATRRPRPTLSRRSTARRPIAPAPPGPRPS
jgi:hypothetical protein